MSNYIHNNWVKPLVIALTVVVVSLAVFAYIKASQAFEADCKAMNGHVKSNTQTSTTSGHHTVNGKQEYGTYTTTNTTTYCIGNDGEGILDVR